MIRMGIMSLAHLHAEAYVGSVRATPGVEIVGAADDDRARGEQFAAALGVRVWSSYRELLAQKLDGVIGQADSTMASAKKAADGLQSAIGDTRKVLQSATQGKGLVATLLNDQKLANDLHALISNLRAHGVLFYRDSAAGQTAPRPQATPSRRAPSR